MPDIDFRLDGGVAVITFANPPVNGLSHTVRAGLRLHAHTLERSDGDSDRELAPYNQGQWATDHHGIYAVSRPYIASIKVLEGIFGG